MINFKKYTNEELNQWVWMWDNCPSTHLLYTEEDYKNAIEEKKKRIREVFDKE